jgi:tetratricopeptide (TPR) repeat protein
VKAQRGRRIVLIGNCQMQAMAGLYKRFVAGRTGDVLEHVPSYQDLTDEHRSAIQEADLIVEQLFDQKQQADTEALSTTAPRIFIPMVTAAFLWPFAGSPHPANGSYPFLLGGPYGGEASDSYLNRLILAGVGPEEAVETYVNLDVNSRVKLDRLFEIVMDRQRARDENAGYRIADIMEQHFRTEQIFLSPYHPNVRIATALASQFFAQLGAERDEIERMRDCTRITPFPKSELPFHPSVCRHFGLEFVTPDRRYRFMNEGLYSFREYALRYMRYEWNDAIEEGIHLSHNGKMDAARERLTTGVARSPFSAAGYSTLGHVLEHQGALDEALVALRRAVAIEPDAAPYRAALGNLLRQTRHYDDMNQCRAPGLLAKTIEKRRHRVLKSAFYELDAIVLDLGKPSLVGKCPDVVHQPFFRQADEAVEAVEPRGGRGQDPRHFPHTLAMGDAEFQIIDRLIAANPVGRERVERWQIFGQDRWRWFRPINDVHRMATILVTEVSISCHDQTPHPFIATGGVLPQLRGWCNRDGASANPGPSGRRGPPARCDPLPKGAPWLGDETRRPTDRGLPTPSRRAIAPPPRYRYIA